MSCIKRRVWNHALLSLSSSSIVQAAFDVRSVAFIASLLTINRYLRFSVHAKLSVQNQSSSVISHAIFAINGLKQE